MALSPRDLTFLSLPSPFYSGQNGQLIYLLRIYCLSGLDLGIEDVAEGRPNPCGFGADRIDGVLSLLWIRRAVCECGEIRSGT